MGFLKTGFLQVCLLATFGLHVHSAPFPCPHESEIFPCECTQNWENNETGFLTCRGDSILQEHIDSLISVVSSVNGNPQQLEIEFFQISYTNLTKLDLNILANCSIISLSITDNLQLTSILPVNAQATRKVDVQALNVRKTPLTNDEVGNLLQYLNPATSPITVDVMLSRMHGVPKGSLIVPGISTFSKLQYLRLYQNNIAQILGGAFEGLHGLETLVLSENKIGKIGTGAFSLGSISKGSVGQNLTIWLGQNDLSDDKIEPQFIPLESSVFYILNFNFNSFEYISAANFQNLMFPSGPIRKLDMTGQNFICDSRMAWVKGAREQLEDKIDGVICTNEPGEISIFETELVYPDFSCPGFIEISPCACRAGSPDDDTEGASLYCDGPLVETEANIQKLFSWVRTANQNPAQVNLTSFNVRDTRLTQIDLNPMTSMSINRIFMTNNQELTTILPPSADGAQTVQVTEGVVLQNNSLTNDAVGNLTLFINPVTGPQYFSVSFNKFGSNDQNSPLVPGLSHLGRLESLGLQANDIGAIITGDFVGFKGLRYLDLSQNNISGIAEGAFEVTSGQSITINLDENQLTDDEIESGFLSASPETVYFLTMRNNSFTFLSKDKFENLIYPRGPLVSVEFDGCPFVCDDRMQWLKAGREKYEIRVRGVICSNDPLGKSIFETDLVSSSFVLLGHVYLVVLVTLTLMVL